MYKNEDEYWLDVTNIDDFKTKFFEDPTISAQETVDAIVKDFPENPLVIVEIGCGYGRLTTLVKNLYPKAYVAGFDINPEILKEAEVYSGWQHERGDTNNYPFYWQQDSLGTFKNHFDAIYAVTVFQHLPDEKKQKYIIDSGKALKKNGVLRIQFIEGDRDNFVDHWVSVEKMKEWFKEAGLKVKVDKGLVHEQWTWITGVK